MTKLYLVLILAALLLPALETSLHAQRPIDRRIDSLKKLIPTLRDDIDKANAYVALLGGLNSRCSGKGGTSADSLDFLRYAGDCRTLSRRLKYYSGLGSCALLQAYFYENFNNVPASIERLEEAISAYRAGKDNTNLAICYAEYADLVPKEDPQRAILLDSALKFVRASGDRKKEAWVLKEIADMHLQIGKYAESIKELEGIVKFQKANGDNRVFYTTDLLSHAYARVGNHKEALRNAIATLDLCYKTGDTALLCTFYQRLGGIYLEMSNYEKSIFYYSKALKSYSDAGYTNIYVAANSVAGMAKALTRQKRYDEALALLTTSIKERHLDSVQRLDQDLMELYYAMKNYAKAGRYASAILRYYHEDFSPEQRMQFFTWAARLYCDTKQFEKAGRYCDSGMILADSLHSWEHLMENNFTLYKLDSVRGDYLSAMRHHVDYKRFSDSIQKDVAGRQAEELAVQYETDQKNADLALLTSQSRLQEETIKQGRTLRNSMIVGSALLLLLLAVIYNRYRLKQRANRSLQEKQDKINQQNRKLEWLMKELNHRVKNNLQVVMGLLDAQTPYLKDPSALDAIHESRHRVQVISLIHRKLYQSDRQLNVIDMATYTREVTNYLSDSLDTGHRIRFNFSIEPVTLDVAEAVPVGLIINEAVTNSIKYAFPGGRYGDITIGLSEENGGVGLRIEDNGVGLSENFDWQHAGTLGMRLMQGLTEQLDGKFEVIPANGLAIKIWFKPTKVFNDEQF